MSPAAQAKILIVDDAIGNIELIGSILGKEFSVCFASSGAEGLELIARYPIDLILLDVMMPGLDGFEVCRRLKAGAATRDIPVIFLTGLESAVDEEYGLSLGADDFIHKPVSPPVVLARVRNHLLLANTKRELRRHNEELELLVSERTQEIVRRDRQLIASQTAIITGFCALAEARDNETGFHIKRTQNYVRLLAEELSDHPRFRSRLNHSIIQLLFNRDCPLGI
jgi:putative two-component system response regulator